MRFGMHLSFKDGPKLAQQIGCKTLQIFCGNPRGWEKKPLDPAYAAQYRNDVAAAGLDPLVVHATYLINLASNTDEFYRKSCEAFITENQRAQQLGAKFYVVHIGNHGGAGPEAGRKKVAACLVKTCEAVPDGPEILVENTAGGGSTLGRTFEEIKLLMDECQCPRLGLCLDTCHALAAGYDIRTADGVKATLDEIERTVGINRLRCIHLNDSKGELNSRLDRHEHIGKGQIGEAGFRAFFADKRVHGLPVVLETPRENVQDELDNLWKAIALAQASGAVSAAEAGTRPTATPEMLKAKSWKRSPPKGKKPAPAPVKLVKNAKKPAKPAKKPAKAVKKKVNKARKGKK